MAAQAAGTSNESKDDSQFQRDSIRSARWLTLLLCFAAAAGLRLAHLAAKPFWFDECFSVELARLGWRNFLHLLWWREANMSIYYLLLRAWLELRPVAGQSEFFIRSLSVVTAVIALPAIYWLARLLYNHRVALIATALLTVNAYSLRYAQEARSYALFLLLATLSSGFLIAWLRKPKRRNAAAYIVFSILAVYVHLYALLLIFAQVLVFSCFGYPDLGPGYDRSRSAIKLRRAWKIIGIAILPLLIFVAKTGAGPIRWIQRPSAHDVLDFFERLAGGNAWLLLAMYALCCLAALIPSGKTLWTRDLNWDTWRARFLIIWLLFPVALTLLLSLARPVFLPRYLIFCLPPLIILASAGLARLPRSWMLAVALTLMLFLGLQGAAFVYSHDFDNERDGLEAASDFILDRSQAGDGIIFHIAEARAPYEFFRSLRAGENTASAEFNRPLGPEILFPRHGAGLDYRDFTGKPTAEFLREMAPGYRRVWVVLIYNGTPGKPDPTTGMISQTLPALFHDLQRWQFPRVELRLYSK
jgi:mannosyltransferase